MASGRLNHYDSGMAGEIAVRRLSPEFWAIVGTAVTVLMVLIGIAALLLTVAGWHREDIRSVEAKLSGEIRALDAKLSGEIKALDAKVATIDKRLAVVESHILGMRPFAESEPEDKIQTL